METSTKAENSTNTSNRGPSTPLATATATATATTTTSSSSATAAAGVNRPQHKAPEETVHMNILGRDGADLDLTSSRSKDIAEDSKPAAKAGAAVETNTKNTNTNISKSPRAKNRRQVQDNIPSSSSSTPSKSIPASSKQASLVTENDENIPSNSGRGWLSKMVWGSKTKDDDEIVANYKSLEAPLQDGSYEDPLQPIDSNNATDLENGMASESNTPTVEDKLRQDCSFFYHGMQDGTPRKKNGLRSLSSALDNVPRVLSSRDHAMFHAKYHRLNQDVVVVRSSDLFLDEDNGETIDFQSENSRNVTDIVHSSLCYEQNGRLLMKLPRDQVRLVMDHDLEPGIISVEQWREPDKILTGAASEYSAKTTPALRFAITVPDDIYKRIVAEMSHNMYPPYWGLTKCCNDTEHADIRWAMAILSVMFLLIFISTMEWPTD